jgi:hypothetical protein
MSTSGKVATAIGLIMGGLGANGTGGRNMAMEFLEKQIDRDIDAQKANLGKKSTLLGAINSQVNDLNLATMSAKAIQMDIYATKLEEAAAKAQDPMAKARALQFGGQIRLQSDMLTKQLAMIQAIRGPGSEKLSAAQKIPFAKEKD